MTVQTVPVSPLPIPGKPAAPANVGNDGAQPPFASVLQKKVDAGKSPEKPTNTEDKPSTRESGEGRQDAARQASSETTGKASNNAETQATPTSEAPAVAAEPAQDVLQTLFPWMQTLQQNTAALVQQASNGKPINTEATLTSDAPQNGLPLMASLPAFNPAVQHTAITPNDGSDTSDTAAPQDMLAGNGKGSGQATAELADLTAKLAAPPDLANDTGKATTGVTSDNSAQTASFEQALQAAAREQGNHTHGVHAGSNPTPVRMQAAVGSPAWQNELGDQVRWMSNQNESRAELILTPPQLGRIEISLNINGDQANALFVSANPQVREALEGAMDRLREVLANSGIALGQAQVGAESFQQSAQGDGNSGGNRGANGLVREDDGLVAPAWSRQSNNMLDVFA